MFLRASNEICSNYISPLVYFYAIFRWTDFRLTHLTFLPQKPGKQVEHGGHQMGEQLSKNLTP